MNCPNCGSTWLIRVIDTFAKLEYVECVTCDHKSDSVPCNESSNFAANGQRRIELPLDAIRPISGDNRHAAN
jgi:Zn ribbon nucleic-acid-binding protein